MSRVKIPNNQLRLARIALWLYAVLFVVFGVPAILVPVPLAATVDTLLTTATARIDFAATYGGSVFGIAAFLAFCAGHQQRLRLGLLANAFFLAGYAIIRGVGIVLALGEVRPILYFILAIELSGAVISFWVASRIVNSEPLSFPLQ